MLFGDGAGAVMLEAAEQGGFLGFELGADGGGGGSLWLPGSGSRLFEDPERFVKMNGREVFKFATRVMVSSAQAILAECGKTVDDIDVYVPHQANIRIINHAAEKLGIPEEKIVVNVDRYGNTSSGLDPAGARRRGGRRPPRARQARADDGNGRRPHVGLGVDRLDTSNDWSGRMTKIAFMFPGQGSFESGMGRDVAEAVPEAMAVYDEASLASGMDLKELCFNRPGRGSGRHRGAAAGARRRRRSRSTRRCARAGSCRTTSSAIRSASSRRSASAHTLSVGDAIALVRERGLAMAEAAKQHPGSMAAILGLADNVVEALCEKIHNVWPANYNCPGQIVISGETPAVDECCSEAELEGARRAIRLRVSGAFHSPLVERAGERLRPAIEQRALPRPAGRVHVDGDREARGRPALPRAARRAAHRSRAVHPGGDVTRLARRDDVRRGRSRECPVAVY